MKKQYLTLCAFVVGLNVYCQVPEQPRLIVAIVVDQMRYDYLEKYKDKFGETGFKRLLKEGFSFSNTYYNYMPTHTGPGHASVFTGTTPSVHGIIANDWYSRELKHMVYCAEDLSVKCTGCEGRQGQLSPRNMLANTIGDQLKESNNKKSKVIGVALKDRAAILPAGHLANGAYWYNSITGNWITSTYYRNELPAWVRDFNNKKLAAKYMESPWNTLLPIEQYKESIADDNPYESPFKGEEKPIFPHNLPVLMKENGGLGLICSTPFGNSLTKDFALEIIKNDSLGKDNHTDMLSISFSSADYIGHRFGPQSVEVQDAYLRLDKEIGELLSFLDAQVGKGNYLVFFTADHGAPDTPAYLKEKKIAAGYIDSKALQQEMDEYCKKTYGKALVMHYINQQVYLDLQKIEENKLDKTKIQNELADLLLKREGVAGVLAAETASKTVYNDSINRHIKNGILLQRSGDIAVNYAPFWIEYGPTGTDHGSPYFYDTHVPLIWFGWKMKQGVSADRKEITSITATLAHLLKIETPKACNGIVLRELVD